MSTPEPVETTPDQAAVATPEFEPLEVPRADEALDDVVAEDAPADDEATEDAAARTLAAIADLGATVAEGQRLLERQIEIASRLHEENQALRAGELRGAQQGLVVGVLRVYDDVRQMEATTDDATGARDLGLVADSLADALARNGVEPIAVEPGEPFDAKRHKVARVATTDDAEADRTVAEVLRPGFVWTDGTPVRVADVVVLKHTPPPVPETEDAGSTDS